MKELEGIITAMVTPFDNTEEVDYQAAENMVEWLIEKGINGIFIAGSNGEFNTLADDEIVELTKCAVSKAKGRVPILSGGGKNSTKETIQLVNRIHSAGADFVSVITPYYQKLSQESIVQHYIDVSNATEAKLVLYNIPSLTGNPIAPESLKKLLKQKNIVGIKDSGGDFDIQKAYLEVTRGTQVAVLNGSDSLMLEAFKEGSAASVAATSNVIPDIEVDLYKKFLKGDFEGAQARRNQMDTLRMGLKKDTPPCIMKMVLNKMGIQAGIPRRPLQESQKNSETAEKILMYYHHPALK